MISHVMTALLSIGLMCLATAALLCILKAATRWPRADRVTGFALSRIQTGIPGTWIAQWAMAQMSPLIVRDLARLSARERGAMRREVELDASPRSRRPAELRTLGVGAYRSQVAGEVEARRMPPQRIKSPPPPVPIKE